MKKQKVIDNFKKISGISDYKAELLYQLGARKKSDLKKSKFYNKLPKLSKWDLDYKINKKISSKLAKNIFKNMKKYLINKGGKFEIVAGVAANKKYNEDLDILTTYNLHQIKFKNNKVFSIVDKIGGKKRKTLLVKYKNNYIKVDIFNTTKNNFVFAKFQYTASKMYNIRIRVHAKSMGYKLSQNGLYNLKTGKRISGIKNDRDIYRILKKKYKPIKQRYI